MSSSSPRSSLRSSRSNLLPLLPSSFAPVTPISLTSFSCFSSSSSSSSSSPPTPAASSRPSHKSSPNPYESTVRLPSTSFSQRSNSSTREPELQRLWSSLDLSTRLPSSRLSSGAEIFTLHDGPPYANGDLHIGHALNKVLKDFVNRREVLKGKAVAFVPGWDCHGLPIELKVLTEMKQKEREGLSTQELRARAKAFALKSVSRQRESFKRYGLYGSFERPYLTLDAGFEASQLGVFRDMFAKGHVYRGRKPVHWSPSSRTALAEAELEYPEKHTSRSVYVKFDIVHASADLRQALAPLGSGCAAPSLAVWTTTPWTLPANAAIAYNPSLTYCVVEHEATGRVVVARDLVEKFEKAMDLQAKFPAKPNFDVLATFMGSALQGTTYSHPFRSEAGSGVVGGSAGVSDPTSSPLLDGGDTVTLDVGTGLVHTAPGHGLEDYKLGMAAGLPILSPVDDEGRFTAEAGERFVGKDVLGDGNQAVIDAIREKGLLIMERPYVHKYPYDWRTKKPTIVRSTSQWFASVAAFRDDALAAVEGVKWIPEAGKSRIQSFVKGRSDWCISRQRSWGVPIPAFYEKGGEGILINEKTIQHLINIFEKEGADAWFNKDVRELLPDEYKQDADKWEKGKDTMDVWFDSGSSWSGVLKKRSNEGLNYPADLYLEGSDQHRGWFQSSLLTSVAANGMAPYKAVLTHGFVLDEKGHKMSKSLGNVVDPLLIIDGGKDKKTQPAYGADLLRMWVASVDYSGDVRVGDSILKQTFESYRKLRNTARYCIGNLSDFDKAKDAVPYDKLLSLDKYMLGQLSATLLEVDKAYEKYDYSAVVNTILRFATSDLSNFYLDVAKDRLYISEADEFRRRSCQTVIDLVLEGFTIAIAPVLPHLAEDIYQHAKNTDVKAGEQESVFQKTWPNHLHNFESGADTVKHWELVRKLRNDVNKALEVARNSKLVGASLDASVYVHCPDEGHKAMLEKLLLDASGHRVDELKYALMVSHVQLVAGGGTEAVSALCDAKHVISKEESESGCDVGVRRAGGIKCERCWYFDESVGSKMHTHSDLCKVCDCVVTKMGFVKKPMATSPPATA